VLLRIDPAALNVILQVNTLDSVHLVNALGWLKPDAPNEMLTTTENGVFKCFEEAAKSGNAEPLA
jgi:hypothetical protein